MKRNNLYLVLALALFAVGCGTKEVDDSSPAGQAEREAKALWGGSVTVTQSATDTNTATNTQTTTGTSTGTGTGTASATQTAIAVLSTTGTSIHTVDQTVTITVTGTETGTSTGTQTGTVASTGTVTQTATNTTTATGPRATLSFLTQTNTATSTLTNTRTSANTATQTHTNTKTATVTKTSTKTATGTLTNTKTSTQTGTASKTLTSTGTATATLTATYSQTGTGIATSTGTKTGTSTQTGTATGTGTRTMTNTAAVITARTTLTSTQTATGSRTFTSTGWVTGVNAGTQTRTATWSARATGVTTSTGTKTATATFAWTGTGLATSTFTTVLSGTARSTGTVAASTPTTVTGTGNGTVVTTNTVTNTGTVTNTNTRTNTTTVTHTNTVTTTGTESRTGTATEVQTDTQWITLTNSSTVTHTNTLTSTSTNTSTSTVTRTITTTATSTVTLGDYGAPCAADAQCASGQCSPTMRMCEVPNATCAAGTYLGHAFTSSMKVLPMTACPAELLPVASLSDTQGTCCATWGAGSCAVGNDSTCDDGLACTADTCSSDGFCGHAVLAGNCLIAGTCHATGASNPGNPCQVCAPASTTSWSNHADGTTCTYGSSQSADGGADGSATCPGNICFAGACQGPAAPGAKQCSGLVPQTCDATGTWQDLPSCDDGNPCTVDACSVGVCSHSATAAGTACSDGNPCNGTETCDGTGLCQPGTPVVCAAIDACHVAGTCDPATAACSNPTKPDGAACEDGNACTAADSCQAGACQAGGPTSIDDGNPCTADACDPVAGVTHVAVAGASCSATLDRVPVNQFKGLNWGYNRTQPDLGNYSRGMLRLPYLNVDDSPAALVQKTNVVLDAFADVGANIIRIPVNIETTLNGWTNYFHFIVKTALERGFKVILCYWLPSTNTLSDMDNVKSMWHALATEYFRDNATGLYPLVFYELANEPAGYPDNGVAYLTDIKSITSYLDQEFSGIKKRIIVGGTGYTAYPGPVAVDPDLQDTYIAVHFYETWAHDYSTTLKGKKYYPKYFEDAIVYQISWNNGTIDPNAQRWFSRLIMTEFGQWTDRQYGYTSKTTQRDQLSITPDTFYSIDVEGYRIAYVWGVVNVVNRLQLGSVLWGGLIEDGYSLFKMTSQPSGIARNDFSLASHLVELDAPYRAGLWGPLSTNGSYVMPVICPVASPDAAEYDSPRVVTLSTSTTGATIYFTTDGSMPTTSSAVYTAPIPVASTTTLKAIAAKSGMQTSTTMSATYPIVSVITPTASLAGGTYNDVQDVTLSCRSTGATIYYTLDGSTPTSASTLYADPVHLSGSSKLQAIAINDARDASAVMSATYTLVASTPTASLASGTYSTPQTVTLASATPGASIYYTTDGSTPTTDSTLYTGPVSIAVSTTLKALSTKGAMTASPVFTATYAIVAVAPTASPAGGTYTTAQIVTLSSATPGASIRYTLDGTPPTRASTLYTGPITLAASTILTAISTKADMADSATLMAGYFFVNTNRVCTAPPSGLLSWWQGEANFVDVFGLNEGQNAGAVGFSPNGLVGQGFALNGAGSSYVNVPHSASLNLTAATTLETWINPATLGGSLIDKSTAGGQDGYALDISNNKLRFKIGSHSVSSAADLPATRWSHAVGTYDGATMKVYINGIQAGSLATTGTIPANTLPLRLGANSLGNSRFSGVIDEAKVYSRAQSATEVTNQYQAGLAKSGVVSWWHGESNFTDALGLNNGVNGGAASFASGTVGQGFKLTGAATSFVAAYDSNSLDFTDAVTMDAWITGTAFGGRIFDKITGGGANGYLLDTYGSKLRVFLGNNATSTGATLTTGVPTHIAATFSTTSGLVRLYINGALAGVVARTAPIPANTLVFRLGADASGNSRFNGVIDEARVFARELSASEILALYREVPCQ